MTIANGLAATPDATLHLPRILCLHGGGVNATIFKTQLRSFLAHASIRSRYRFVFVEGPVLCEAAAGVHPVYTDYGPFRRWVRWLPSHAEISDKDCRSLMLSACQSAMDEDQRAGATGEWTAVIGFSQGAKLAATLLYEMQIAQDGEQNAGGVLTSNGKVVEWRFGVIFAGRAPLVALSEASNTFPWCQRAGGLPGNADMDALFERPEMKLRIPTVHVHGLKDEGLELHRRLSEDYCAPGTATVVEWEGAHRIPIKKGDVDKIVNAIIEVADEYGV